MEVAIIIASVLFNLTLIGLGIYFKGYLVKKADIKAINENFDVFVSQLEETTRVSKLIEGKLGNRAWLHQQRWDIKKDFYIAALDLLNQMNTHFEGIATRLVRLQNINLTLEEKNDLENQIEHGLEVIKPLVMNLESQLMLKGILFLKDEALGAIERFIDAEQHRVNILNDELSEGGSSENMKIAAIELGSKTAYLDTQIGACSLARKELIKEARKDLKIVWED